MMTETCSVLRRLLFCTTAAIVLAGCWSRSIHEEPPPPSLPSPPPDDSGEWDLVATSTDFEKVQKGAAQFKAQREGNIRRLEEFSTKAKGIGRQIEEVVSTVESLKEKQQEGIKKLDTFLGTEVRNIKKGDMEEARTWLLENIGKLDELYSKVGSDARRVKNEAEKLTEEARMLRKPSVSGKKTETAGQP